MLYDGVPLASALLLSHPEQIERVATDVPEASHVAVLAGDPCYDRMLASRHRRARYRAALGVDDGRRLIVTTTTWSASSLLGSWPTLLRQLLAELPVDQYQVLAITHPNASQAHGEAQLKSWFADCIRAGLTLVPPLEGWRAALVAADLVIGDHGATCCYGAALGRPVLLGAFPDDQIVPGTAVHRLGQLAPRLRPGRALRVQVETTLAAGPEPGFAEIAELVSAAPGAAAGRIRSAAYRLVRLAEPDHEAAVSVLPTDGLTARSGLRSTALLVNCQLTGDRAQLARFPADVQRAGSLPPTDDPTHLLVHRDHPDRSMLAAADVIVDEVMTAQPADARVFHAGVDGHACTFSTETGRIIELTARPGLDTSVLASLAYSWRAAGRSWEELIDGVVVELGPIEHPVLARYLD